MRRMITTNSKELYDKLNLLRTHGITKDANKFINNPDEIAQGGWYYEMQQLGYNYRLTDFQAALGVSQLTRADENLSRRRILADRYDEALKSKDITIPDSFAGNAYHLYVIQVANRLELYNRLKEKNIFAQVHYVPCHLMPYYSQFGYKKGDFPHAENYYNHCLSIPMYHSLSNDDQDYVISQIKEFIG